MANEQNLKPIQQSSEEATKNGRKGGIASGKARREKRTFREIAEMIGAMPANERTRENVKKVVRMKDKDISYDVAIVVNNVMRAVNGDARAADWLSRVKGEDKIQAEISGSISTPRELSKTEAAELLKSLEDKLAVKDTE